MPLAPCSVPELADTEVACADPTLADWYRLILRAYRETQRLAVDGGAFAIKRSFLEHRRRCGGDRACILTSQMTALRQFERLGSTIRMPLGIRSATFELLNADNAGGPTAPAVTLRELLDGIEGGSSTGPQSDPALDGGLASGRDAATADPPRPATGPPQKGAAVERAALLIAPPDALDAMQVYVGQVAWLLRPASPSQTRPSLSGHVAVPTLSLSMDVDLELGQPAAPPGPCFVAIAFHRADPGRVGSVATIDLPRARRPNEPLGKAVDGAKLLVASERFIVGVLHAAKRGPCGSTPDTAWMDFPVTLSSGLVGKVTVELPSGSDPVAQALR